MVNLEQEQRHSLINMNTTNDANQHINDFFGYQKRSKQQSPNHVVDKNNNNYNNNNNNNNNSSQIHKNHRNSSSNSNRNSKILLRQSRQDLDLPISGLQSPSQDYTFLTSGNVGSQINAGHETEEDEECTDVRSETSRYCNLNHNGGPSESTSNNGSIADNNTKQQRGPEQPKQNLDGIKELLAYKRQRFQSMDSFESTVSLNSKSKRLVTKDGFVDIKYSKIPGYSSRFVKDIFHTLMDLKWRYITGLFTISFLLTWIFFGTFWFLIVYYQPHRNCVDNVDSWVSAFLFSIETQTTIGYGGRAVTSNCPEGVLLLVVQTIVGMFVNCAMLGLLFAKLARPKNRGKTTMFSKRAVVTVRDEHLCLMFRYVDLRHKRLLDTNMRAVIIRPKLTEEGEFIPIDMADMKLTIDFAQEEYTMRLFPLFPLTIIHVIDETSPLYTMSKTQLEQSEFEIIPILEGTVPTTGNSTQALTSYRPGEILWGYRFKPVFTGMHIGQNINRIDLSTLHDTYKERHTPPCSAEMYYKTKRTVDDEDDDDDDCSSLADSNGYESGPLSSYSAPFRYGTHHHKGFLTHVRDHVDVVDDQLSLELNKEYIQNLPLMKESTA